MYKILVDNILMYDSRIEELALINPVVTLEENKAGSFSFKIPPNHPYYDLIQRRKSVVQVFQDDDKEPIFSGMCIEISNDFYKQKEIYCEGELSYFNDSIQRPARYQDIQVRRLLEKLIENHNEQVEATKRFEVGIVTAVDANDSLYCYTNMESTMKCLKEDLADDLGGFFRIRHQEGVKYLDYLAGSQNTNTQIIKLGKNLLDFTSNIDSSEIATAIIPLGAKLEESDIEGLEKRLTIESINDGKDYVHSQEAVDSFGWIYKVVTWDDVTTAEALKRKAEMYLSEIQFENMVIEAKAVDLHLDNSEIERFKLSDEIRVVSKPHGLDKYFRLTKMTINLNNPESNTITLGKEEKTSLSAKTNQENVDIKNAIEKFSESAILNTAIANATQLIQNSMNGYITTVMNEDGKPIELLIMDTNDIKTATKVWRWNINGLGYSSTGYNGNYALAMTMDGAIVADRILSGTMFADRIKGGTFTAGGFNNENGVILVKDADGKVLITLNKEGITFSGGQKIKYSDISGTPTNISSFTNDSGFVNENTTTEIARNEIRTANIVCSQLKGGTIELGGSTTTPANLKLYNESDELIGLWNVDGMYAKSKMARYSEFSDVIDFTRNNDIFYLQGTHTNKRKMKIKSGTMRVYLIISDDSTSTLEACVSEPDESTTVYYRHEYTINKNSCVKCFPGISSNLQEYYALEQNPNVYYTDIDMVELTKDFKTDENWKFHWLGFPLASEKTQIAGIRFKNLNYEDVNKGTTVAYDSIFIKNCISSHAKQMQIDMLRSEIDIGDIEIKTDLIELYPDAKIVGKKSIGYASFEGVYSWEDAMVLSTEKLIHKASYGNASSTSGTKSLYVQSDGTFISSSSSRRYKENISYDVDKYHCEGLYDVNVAEFKYKDEFGGGNMEIGLIAEDIAEHFPHGAIYNEDGTVESWSERTMIPALLKLIQDQNKRIKILEKEVLEKCQI